MKEALVRGVRLVYEVIGNQGPWIALTPGSRRSYGELSDFGRMLATHGYRVLLHDRRNCGSSEVAFDASASEHEIWADDLYELCKQCNALPVVVGGSSAGARLAILFSLRHPSAVKALLLWRVTGGDHAVSKLAQTYYGEFIAMAQKGGMAAVCASEHFAACIASRPSNRERLLQMPVADFVNVMTVWQEKFLRSMKLPIIGATEADIRSIEVPACIIAGNDVIHTPATAHKVQSLFQNATLCDNVVEKRAEDDLLAEWDRKEWKNAEGRMAQIFSEFLNQKTS